MRTFHGDSEIRVFEGYFEIQTDISYHSTTWIDVSAEDDVNKVLEPHILLNRYS